MHRFTAIIIVFYLIGLSIIGGAISCQAENDTKVPIDDGAHNKVTVDKVVVNPNSSIIDAGNLTFGSNPKNISVLAWVETPFLQRFEARGNDVLQWSFDTDCSWLTWNNVDHVVSGVPTMLNLGECWVRVGVSDKPNNTDEVALTINISRPNGSPAGVKIISPIDGRAYTSSEALNLTFEGSVMDRDPVLGLNYSWYDNGQSLANGSFAKMRLSPGMHIIELRVFDGNETSSAKVMIKVLGAAPMRIGPKIPSMSGPGLVATVLVPSLLLTVLAFALTETGRYGLLAPFAPLYSKIKKDSLLDNFTRGKIFQYIMDHPGAHLGVVQRSLGLKNGLAVYHLRKLEQDGFVVSRRMGVRRLFYPSNMEVPLIPSNHERILVTIRTNPGISQTEIGRELDISLSTVNDYINRLRTAKFIKVIKKGKRTLCFILPEGP